ncbi:MAG: phosphomannomutase/phosphoglucomutase [Patescibacteria group bacterium]
MDESIFKAYDIRGIYKDQINEDIVARIGYFFVKYGNLQNICVGRDIRSSSPSLFQSFIKGAISAGARVTDIGIISTDMMYFAAGYYKFDGGAQITASHNPKEYNGVKLVLRDVDPISGDNGMYELRDMVKDSLSHDIDYVDKIETAKIDILDDYVNRVLSFVDKDKIKGLKVVVDAGNGVAGYVVDAIFKKLDCELVSMYFEPDENFPNHPANPMEEANLSDIEKKVIEVHADLGVAFDGDADRCGFIDNNGVSSTGYFITALLAKNILIKNKGSKIIHDPRQVWAIDDTVKEMGGIPIISKAGHSFIASRMKKEDAIFAGEISSHFYFKDNFYSDNGMIPMLMMMELLKTQNTAFSSLLSYYRSKYFTSPEINYEVSSTDRVLNNVEKKYSENKDCKISHIDGLSVDFSDWRFNLRGSNTEPLVRLNVEAKSQNLLDLHLKEVENFIKEDIK